ncbi:DoxX family protein [Sphingomonas sp. PAMC 26605]|uniref:DoxX family protein n=1 Tax=Sphingomonas sp. PAMC 26605 TaxID=1112214 RepID=UPI00026CB5C2|nr:DoxX family protein [Sphingomonas sp. PAMC 26605]
MSREIAPPRPSATAGSRFGLALSALLVVLLVADGMVDLVATELVRPQMEATGFPPSLAIPIGCIILVCAVLYAIPSTAVLGAILVTAFAGGAICTHLRMQEVGSPPEWISVFLGVLAWGGLYLRDDRVRALLPLR